jgi:hypothetical protein
MNHKEEPISVVRKCAQITQILRLGKCEHPEYALVQILVQNGGFIEYCSDCDKITCVLD